MTGLLVTLVAFPLIGAAISRFVGRTSSFLMGLGALGMTLHATLLLQIPIVVTLGSLLAGALAVLLFKRGERWHRDEFLHPATIVMALPCAFLLYASANIPLHDFDGRAFWLLKAKAIATERHIDGPFFKGETTYDPRNRYPLLIPLDAAAVMIGSRDTDDRHVRWIYPLALIALAWHARKWIGPWPAALLPWIPQFVVTEDGGVLSAYNDVIVAAFAGCAFFELLERRSPVRFGLWLAFLTLTKSEGLPYAAVLFAAGIVVFGRRILTAAAPFAVAVATLLIWRSRVPPGDEEDFLARLPHLPERLDRIAPALLRLAQHAVRMDLWGLFWIATIIAAIALLIRGRRREAALPAYVLAAMTFVYACAFAVSAWVMNDLIDASVDRLLMHLVIPALYLISRSVVPRPGAAAPFVSARSSAA